MKKKFKIFKKNVERKIKHKEHYEINKDGKKVIKRKILKMILLLIIILCIAAMLTLGAFFAYIVIKAPTFDPDALYDTESSVLYDKDGNEYARLGTEVRDIVSYDQLPEVLVDSIVATEDSRFFQHNGFDLPRFLVASLKQLLGNSSAGGASTLTMQISKNKITDPDLVKDSGMTGIIRKFTDIYIAVFKIEKTYTKQEIMEFYVNSNYLGAGVNGVEDAAQVYFGKSVSE